MSWGRPGSRRPKLPRGPPRTQEASFPGLAGRRLLPPRALPPLQTPSDSACLTPLLLPSGPGWGRGSAGCARAVGSAGTLRPDRYRARWRGGGGSGSRLPPRRVRSRPKRGNWRQGFHGGAPQRTPLAQGFPTRVLLVPAARFPGSARRLAAGSLSPVADQSPFGVQNSRRFTCATPSPSFVFLFCVLNFHSG